MRFDFTIDQKQYTIVKLSEKEYSYRIFSFSGYYDVRKVSWGEWLIVFKEPHTLDMPFEKIKEILDQYL